MARNLDDDLSDIADDLGGVSLVEFIDALFSTGVADAVGPGGAS